MNNVNFWGIFGIMLIFGKTVGDKKRYEDLNMSNGGGQSGSKHEQPYPKRKIWWR